MADPKPPVTEPGPVRATAEPKPPVSEPGPVREVKPETYYMPNKEGTLVPVLNMPFEEFERLWREARLGGTGPALPAYSLQELTINGQVRGQHAELDATIGVRPLRDGWVKVPLRFAGAILREPARRTGNGEFFLTCEGDGNGFTGWLRAVPDKTLVLSLKLAAPLQQFGNETRLTLPVPRATTSALDFRVGLPNAKASVNGGVLEERKADQGTQFHVTGPTGDFVLAWRSAEARLAPARPLLVVQCDALVKVEGLRQVSGELRLRVSSLSGEFNSFALRLPPGTRLLSRPVSGLQVTEASAADPSGSRVVQVRLDRRTAGPVDLQLLTEFSPLDSGKMAEFEVGGVDVEDAVRQSGAIEVAVRGDWFMTWKPGPNVQRTALPEPSRTRVAARFEFVQRPYSLRMQVAQKETQTSVEPTYVLHVYSDQVRLEAMLKYRIRGPKAQGVHVELADWRVTGVGPESLIAQETLDTTSVSPLHVPLTSLAQTESGEFTVRVEATQDIPRDAGTVSVKLPRPEATTLSPATVAVVPADNVELTVTEAALQGLERQSTAPAVELPLRQQTPLYFRERGDVVPARFAASLRVRQRAVSVGLAHEVRVDARRARVEERLRYRVAYEPLRRIALDVPVTVADSLQVLLEDQALPSGTENTKPAAAPDSDQRVVREFDLLGERIGAFDINLQYSCPLGNLTATSETDTRIPLVLPALSDNTTITSHTLHVATDRLIQARLGDTGEVWESAEPGDEPEGPADGGLRLVCSEPAAAANQVPHAVPLLLRRADGPQRGSTHVSQAWVQTWSDGAQCRDRAVFRVATEEDCVTFQLPASATLEDLALDGVRIRSVDLTDPRTVIVDFPEENPPAEHVVELWYAREPSDTATGVVTLEAPAVAGVPSVRRWYWQIVLPADQHLLRAPAGLTPEFTWVWRGWMWQRQSTLDQPELERWLGASPQDPLPDAANHYLFSSFGELPVVTAKSVPRLIVLGCASGGMLLLGLVLIYLPMLRHPALLLAASLTVLVCVAGLPDLSLPVLQASAFGVALALAACILKTLIEARQARRRIVRGTTAGTPESHATLALGGRGSSVLTTTVVPVAPSVPVAEQQP
jgi:hypothetical protein